MSRIGRMPVIIPANVTYTNNGNVISVKGPKGELTTKFNPHLIFEEKPGVVEVKRPNDSILMKMNHGTARANLNDMVKGVTEGFSKVLVLKGVGYRAEMRGNDLVLHVGHSHEDVIAAVEGAKIEFNSKAMEITISGINKQLVGQVAANIRDVRKPECYHGKGIRYKDEVVVLRQAASAKKSAGGK
ncbi:MAG: 50S ribosomal protein L6 [Bacilli bacterium]